MNPFNCIEGNNVNACRDLFICFVFVPCFQFKFLDFVFTNLYIETVLIQNLAIF